MTSSETAPDTRPLVARIVAAYAAGNTVPVESVAGLITLVQRTIAGLGNAAPAEPARPEPAVPIKRSVFPDHIVCLEDGRKFKTLRRHLMTAFKLTPEQYRARWGLPSSYPMVAPKYAATRSALAKELGLGRKEGKGPPEAVAAEPPARSRGRPRKAAAAR